MLDQQHGHAAIVADLADQSAELDHLVVIEAAGRLVEQQELWLGPRARAPSSTRFCVPNGSSKMRRCATLPRSR